MSGIGKLSSLMASLATQVRAAIHVGVPVEDTAEAHQSNACELMLDLSDA
jgi:hypothetical protein